MMDLGDYLERCVRPEKVGDFTLLIQGLKCAGAGKCEFAAQYRSLAGWFSHEMQSKLFGNRTVLGVGVSSNISNVNESSGIVNNKSFGVLGGFRTL